MARAPQGKDAVRAPDVALSGHIALGIRPSEAQLKSLPLKLKISVPVNNLAPWFVEDLRRYLERKYGSDQVHQGGLRVYTSLDLDLQKTATQTVLDGLAAYERRHLGRGGAEGHVRVPA